MNNWALNQEYEHEIPRRVLSTTVGMPWYLLLTDLLAVTITIKNVRMSVVWGVGM